MYTINNCHGITHVRLVLCTARDIRKAFLNCNVQREDREIMYKQVHWIVQRVSR